jgi:hypothetical protein
MLSLGAIRSRYYAAAKRLNAPKEMVRFATQPTTDGGPHVERVGDAYVYAVWERGTELERRVTQDPDELLYWLVSALTFEMACQYELSHRVPGKDSRRPLFEKQLELLRLVNQAWSERKQIEFNAILREHPFSDGDA